MIWPQSCPKKSEREESRRDGEERRERRREWQEGENGLGEDGDDERKVESDREGERGGERESLNCCKSQQCHYSCPSPYATVLQGDTDKDTHNKTFLEPLSIDSFITFRGEM